MRCQWGAMDLSFVIPAHDEEAYLPATLGAIRRAMSETDLAFEIVVAADGCTDATESVAESLGARVVSHARRQIAATRNFGARASRGRWIAFVDADTQVTPESVREMLAILRGGAAGGGGPIRLDGPLPLYIRVMLCGFTTAFRWLRLTGGAFVFCTREAFDRSGGFDEVYYAGEELYFARALKRLGRFELTRSGVITSGRKARTFTARDILGLFWRGLITPSVMKDRARLGFFYGPRRADPYAPASTRTAAERSRPAI